MEIRLKTATYAFCNESLSIQDRILAAKLRIVSEILESLESPETAITGCLSFLRKLHTLPAIQKMFTVYLEGGVKSILKKSERVESVKSIMLINYVLFQYSLKFGSKYCSAYTWPKIELVNRSFRPTLDWQEVWTRRCMRNELRTQQPNRLFLDLEHEIIQPRCSAVNSHGEVVVGEDAVNIKVILKTGQTKIVELPEPGEGKDIEQYIIVGIAVDNNDNVYVVRWLKTRTENGVVRRCVLHVLDKKYNAKQDCFLDFFEETDYMRIAINKTIMSS